MRIGVAYYPEHWPEERWPVDARLMREAGVDVVRLAEFAWSRLEPQRRRYDMEWLERAVDALAEEGLAVILCTPTAAPPTWLFNRHPHIVPRDREGNKWWPGSRRHACLNSRPYRRYVRRIVREVAKTFGGNPHVVGWQIDNEIGCHGSGRCYCDDCEQAFREWLKKRYGTIERLNKLWGTAFWSQEFNDWIFVPSPRRTPAGVHPSLALDYERFTTATAREFVEEQRGLIEDYAGTGAPITTNCMGTGADQINQFSLGGVQDVASFDNYPVGGDSPDGPALQLDLTRSLKGRPFWVLEQQAGPTMIPSRPHSNPRPGKLRLWTYQAAARGAELISYFRWRTCRAGQEMHWYGMLEADGSMQRRYRELRRAIEELKEAAPQWRGRLPAASVAMVLDYDSHWGLRADSMTADLDYMAHFRRLHAVLRRMGVVADVVPVSQDLSGYPAAVAPMPLICREETAQHWSSYVQGGGRLLVTAPAGYRTEQNAWGKAGPPGPLSDLLGVQVPEHDVLRGGAEAELVAEGETFPARSFCSILELYGAEPTATYRGRFYDGRPAATRNERGRGSAHFLGALSDDRFYRRALRALLEAAGVEPCEWASETVEVVPLQTGGAGHSLTFVLNHGPESVELELEEGAACRELICGRRCEETVTVEADGVVLLQR